MKMPSVQIAKDRLRNLLNADRMQCTPDTAQRMTQDLYHTIRKYVQVSPEEFEIEITRSDIHIKYTGEFD